jgi:sterol desaturase/sphingolipid hydroxylase (fatty acid hydroxylase superfamily)
MLLAFSIIALLAFVAERLWPARPQALFRTGFITDGIYLVINIILRIAITNTLAIAVSRAGEQLFPSYTVAVLRDAPLWVQAVAVIVVIDFCFYWMHRAKHSWAWWWRLHETHHSSRDLDWFSSVRFHPAEKILDRLLYLLPLLFLGVSDAALVILSIVDATVASFSHANTRLRIGPLIYVFVGPEMHRWHHARDIRFQNVNFSNNLSIFDWLFGTAYVPPEAPREFGLDDEAYPEGNIARQFTYAFRPMKPALATPRVPLAEDV